MYIVCIINAYLYGNLDVHLLYTNIKADYPGPTPEDATLELFRIFSHAWLNTEPSKLSLLNE